MNITDWLYAQAVLDAPAPALFQGSHQQCSYGQFAHQARRVAQALTSKFGIRAGDRVALYMKNSTDYLVCMFGVLWAGGTIVPVNYKLHPKEVAWILNDSGSKQVVTDAALMALETECGLLPLSQLLKAADDVIPEACLDKPVQCRPQDLAWIFYTSGTTGRPGTCAG